MIGTLARQASLFSFAFFNQTTKIAHPELDPMDALLDDPALVALAAAALAGRAARSESHGRPTLAPDRLLRCVVLKHLKQWSFRELESEVRVSLLYRRFTRFYEDPIPDFSSFSRAFALFGTERTRQIHEEIMRKAQALQCTAGEKLRTDTTVVETNIHYPTDSSLLVDSVRVLTRSLERIAQHCREGQLKVIDRTRPAKHHLLEICRAARLLGERGREQLQASYGKLLDLSRGLVAEVRSALTQLDQGRLVPRGGLFPVVKAQGALRHYLPLVEQVIMQTDCRIFGAETRCPGKILSLFEPHTVVVRKGKAHKPNEFGRLVRIDEVEGHLVSNYQIAVGNPADQQQWIPALQSHRAIFGAAPVLATADRGFFSAHNEKAAAELGVGRTVLPGRGRLSRTRQHLQKQQWFQGGQAWRAGIEARISTLKHRFGLERAFYKGEIGFERHVGWCVIAHNLVAMSRRKLQPAVGAFRSG